MAGVNLLFDGARARLRLCRREARNAIDAASWAAFPALCDAIEAHPSALAVIVEGEGADFSAGADIGEFAAVYRDGEASANYLASIQAALVALARLARPTLACLRGSVIGGGLALALACDLRFAATSARFAVPPAKLGLLYGPVETRRLVALIGPARAKDMIFSARTVTAEEALSWGLVDRVVEAAELDGAVAAYADAMAALSQGAIRGAKEVIETMNGADEAWALRTLDLAHAAAMSADAREGRAAFLAKRRPKFGV